VEPLLSDEEQKVWDILNAPVPKTPREELDHLKVLIDEWWADPVKVAKFMEGFKKRHGRKSK
jgi:hypothetical protein